MVYSHNVYSMLKMIRMPKGDGDLGCLFVECGGDQRSKKDEEGEEGGEGDSSDEDTPKQKRAKKEKPKGVLSVQVQF